MSPAPAAGGTASGTDSLVRSSGVMAVGTLASRITGFLRTAVLVYALGTGTLADAYNNANTLPNTVYNLALGGILTSVVVPLLVSAAKRDSDRGEAYDQRIFTLVRARPGRRHGGRHADRGPAGQPVRGGGHGSEHTLMVIFAYFFIPQIFFYGVSSLAGAILNARGSFAAPMWTPVRQQRGRDRASASLFMLTAGLNLNTAGRSPRARSSCWASAPRSGIVAADRRRWCPRCGGSGSAGGRGSTSAGPR